MNLSKQCCKTDPYENRETDLQSLKTAASTRSTQDFGKYSIINGYFRFKENLQSLKTAGSTRSIF